MSYRTRLQRDLERWEAIGLIDAGQRERIAADASRSSGTSYLQGVLVLCAVILASAGVVAFVAANWSGLAPLSRMAVLFLADAAVLAGAYAASHRAARSPSTATCAIADGAATLSLAVAAATLALVAQTFHLPSDPRGFAQTIAGLGLVTALVARSGGAALVASVALALADSGQLEFDIVASSFDTRLLWLVGIGLFLGCISDWLPAKASILLVLLIALADHFGAVFDSRFGVGLRPERALAIAAFALGLGCPLAALPDHQWTGRLRAGGEALARAASGLCLLGIVAAAIWATGWGGDRTPPAFGVPLAAVAVAAVSIGLVWFRQSDKASYTDVLVLGAAALSLGALLAGWHPSVGRSATYLPAAWTVWGGIVPCLMLVVAGHVEERRALFGWALVAVAGLTIGMLSESSDLIGFALNLLGTALLVCLTIALCRWSDRRLVARTA